MQVGFSFLTLVGLLLGFSTIASAQPGQPVLVTAPVEKVFVPLGFDDNDDVEVVLHGHFPNTCYKTGPVTASVDPATGTVGIDAKAYLYQGVGCAQVMVPFVQSVKLGLIRAGTYAIQVYDRPDTESVPLTISEARTSNPDDYLYAPVGAVALDKTDAGTYAVQIAGEYPYTFVGCMIMNEVRAYLSPGNTLVVLPIAELIDRDDHPACIEQGANKKFTFTVDVGLLAAEEYLLHVRVLEGNSLNRFVDLYN